MTTTLFGKITIALILAMVSAAREGQQDGNSERLLLTDEEKLENALNDERNHSTYVSTSKLGSNIARVLSSLSIVSLLFLILLIYRSEIGLSTIYHRIVFCMSVAYILAAMAMGLTTLPMPTDMIYTQYETAVYGNQATCTAQGLVFAAGTRTAFLYFSSLSIYYLSSIRLKMSESQMRKRVEPWIHCYILCSTTVFSTLCIAAKFINPTPDSPWCRPMSYPWYCNRDNFEDCTVRDTNLQLASAIIFIIYAENFVTIITFFSAMALIVWTVYKQERLLKTYMARVHSRNDSSTNLAMCRSRHQFTRTIMFQALSYLVVYVLFSLDIYYIAARDLSHMVGNDVKNLDLWTRYYYLTSKPMQGFVYFLVFVGHKVYGIRQVDRNLTISKAILHVLRIREEPTFFISRISLVNGALSNGDEDEMYFVGDYEDDEDDYEEEDISRMYPFPGQNGVVEDHATSSSISFERENEYNHSRRTGSVERSSFGPASWFSMSTRRSETTSVPRNRRKTGHDVYEDDAISGIGGKMESQDDDMEEIEVSESVETFEDNFGTDSESRGGVLSSSIGPASWFSRSTGGRSEASSVKDNSKE